MMVVNGCPCGEAHRMSGEAHRKFKRVVAEHAADVPVGNAYGCWRVPRIWIACHGITAASLPALAERFSWPKA